MKFKKLVAMSVGVCLSLFACASQTLVQGLDIKEFDDRLGGTLKVIEVREDNPTSNSVMFRCREDLGHRGVKLGYVTYRGQLKKGDYETLLCPALEIFLSKGYSRIEVFFEIVDFEELGFRSIYGVLDLIFESTGCKPISDRGMIYVPNYDEPAGPGFLVTLSKLGL